MTLAVVAALPEEMAPLSRRLAGREPAGVGEALACALDGVDIRLMVTGDGPRRAGEAVAGLLRTLSFEVLVGIGVAGGLTADLAPGDLVVVERVLDETGGQVYEPAPSRWLERGRQATGGHAGTSVSARAIAGDLGSKKRLSGLGGRTAVVDLESAAWCEAASRAAIPWVIARAVSDAHDEALPLDFESLRDGTGAVDRSRVLRTAVLRPVSWRPLWRLRRRLARAGEALADWSLEVLAA